MKDHAYTAAWEAQASRPDLLDMAIERWLSERKWPLKRWRIEGTAAGNSRLLGEREAHKQRGRLGGTVVEVIPSRPSFAAGLSTRRRRELDM